MKIAILSNGPGNYSTKRLREVAKARGHTVLQAFILRMKTAQTYCCKSS